MSIVSAWLWTRVHICVWLLPSTIVCVCPTIFQLWMLIERETSHTIPKYLGLCDFLYDKGEKLMGWRRHWWRFTAIVAVQVNIIHECYRWEGVLSFIVWVVPWHSVRTLWRAYYGIRFSFALFMHDHAKIPYLLNGLSRFLINSGVWLSSTKMSSYSRFIFTSHLGNWNRTTFCPVDAFVCILLDEAYALVIIVVCRTPSLWSVDQRNNALLLLNWLFTNNKAVAINNVHGSFNVHLHLCNGH